MVYLNELNQYLISQIKKKEFGIEKCSPVDVAYTRSFRLTEALPADKALSELKRQD